ncbi:hypothetical protein GALMADRAFT_139767 [Galerina marginata CBS 339.88]|uniref:Uncharacterized protein n=1 Tax=Galerina marginata (strain CBS 339.88) TaxID=685588 RepID=A0A067SYS5_GALM3|nr:hypothetical protein GALMADRAFT_139767 [Galerina marginata CBS 339.88]
MPEPLFLKDYSPPSLLIGIAFYLRHPNDRAPAWKFIFHKRRYTSKNVMVAGINKVQTPGGGPADYEWAFEIEQDGLGEPLAVVHIGRIPWTRMEFLHFLRKFKAGRDGDNPGQVTVWSSSAWVIRVLHYLEKKHGRKLGFKLPFRSRRLFSHIWPYIEKQRDTQPPRAPRRHPPAVLLHDLEL